MHARLQPGHPATHIAQHPLPALVAAFVVEACNATHASDTYSMGSVRGVNAVTSCFSFGVPQAYVWNTMADRFPAALSSPSRSARRKKW